MKLFIKKGLLLALIFFCINLLIFFILEIPTISGIKTGRFQPKRMWEEFYNQTPESLDLIFSGSSHCVHSFNPKIFDNRLGLNSFNMGTAAQSPITGYYVIKEALKTQSPKLIVFEAYWEILSSEYQFGNAYDNIRYMRSTNIRLEFLVNGFETPDIMSFAFPSMRYNELLFRVIPHLFGNRTEELDNIYMGKGFVTNEHTVSRKSLEEANLFDGYIFDNSSINSRREFYLKKIIQLCRDEGIEFLLVISPIPPASLKKIANYKNIHDYFLSLTREYNIKYLDYNYYPYPEISDKDFMDNNHLNYPGSGKISMNLAEKISLLFEPILMEKKDSVYRFYK